MFKWSVLSLVGELSKIIMCSVVFFPRKLLQKQIESATDRFLHSPIFQHAGDGDVAVNIIKVCLSNKLFSTDSTGKLAQCRVLPDVILMDYVMLALNGPEASKIIKYELGYTGPIIGITGNVMEADIRYFKASGANEVLPKPLVLNTLLDLFRDHRLIL